MRIEFKPSKGQGVLITPPSKSMAHRLLIAAGLSDGCSRIGNVAYSEDISATIGGLEALGVQFEKSSDALRVISGIDLKSDGQVTIDCRESGSTLRFLIPVALTLNRKIDFIGSPKLFTRPLDVYRRICEEQGMMFDLYSDRLTVCGKLSSGEYRIPGNVSSQFVSGLLFALPLLSADSRIILTTEVESKPYIDMTIDVLRSFNVEVDWVNDHQMNVPGYQRYMAHNSIIEGDYSNTAVFMGLNGLGNAIRIEGLKADSLQGDAVAEKYFHLLDGKDAVIDLAQCPDLGPVLFAYAAAKNGGTFINIKRLRLKESDRVAAMIEELQKFGIMSNVTENRLSIPSGQRLQKPVSVLMSHYDHRIVMALSMLLTLTGGCIDDAEAVNKSFPDYFERLKVLGFDINIINRL